MKALREIYALLAPLGLYKLNGSSLVDHELAAYGQVLGHIEEAISRLVADIFVQTASGGRLDEWERLLRLPNGSSLQAEQRRKRILHHMAVSPLSFTPSGITDSLRGVGMEAVITEDTSQRSLHITCLSFMGDYGNIYEMMAAAGKMMPAHLAFYIDTGGVDWSSFEEFFASWQDFDQMDNNWQQLDIKTNFE